MLHIKSCIFKNLLCYTVHYFCVFYLIFVDGALDRKATDDLTEWIKTTLGHKVNEVRVSCSCVVCFNGFFFHLSINSVL